MFDFSSVYNYLRLVLSFDTSMMCDFVNVVPGECDGDITILKGSDIEKYIGTVEYRKMECQVVKFIY